MRAMAGLWRGCCASRRAACPQFDQAAYDIMLGDCLWQVCGMIGKLSRGSCVSCVSLTIGGLFLPSRSAASTVLP